MNSHRYIVPTALFETVRLDAPHQRSAFPADPTQSLLRVDWPDGNAQRDFEALAGVVFLGYPWEPVPNFAIPLIASLPQEDTAPPSLIATATAAPATPVVADTSPPSIARALRRIGWASH